MTGPISVPPPGQTLAWQQERLEAEARATFGEVLTFTEQDLTERGALGKPAYDIDHRIAVARAILPRRTEITGAQGGR